MKSESTNWKVHFHRAKYWQVNCGNERGTFFKEATMEAKWNVRNEGAE